MQKPVSPVWRVLRHLIFPVLMVVYVWAFLKAAGWVTARMQRYMAEYEVSRPKYAMDAYLEHLGDDYYSDLVLRALDSMELSEFETPALLFDAIYQGDPADHFIYQQLAGESTRERPVYELCCGGFAMAKVALERAGGTEGFGFPIWRVTEPESLLQIEAEPRYSVDITVPEGAVLKINGVMVPPGRMEEADPELVLDNYQQQYAAQPRRVHYAADGLRLCPVVTAVNADGEPLVLRESPKEDAAVQTYVYEPADVQQPDEQLVQRVENLTRAYISYVTNNGRNGTYNLGVLAQYLVPGSAVHQKMSAILPDISWNNQYERREDKLFTVRHVKQYSEKLCTVELDFDIVLTKVVTNEYTGSIRWVMVDTGYGWYAAGFTLFDTPVDPMSDENV